MRHSDPTPTLPLPGEGADRALVCSSTWQGGGREGVVTGAKPKLYSQKNSIFNLPAQIPQRLELRKKLTVPERILWSRLRCQQLGTKFRRQQGVGHYIVDFYCAEFSLVIELDGDSHYSPEALVYDKQRDAFMQSRNIHTLRVANNEVINNLDGVLSHILQLLSLATPQPAPPPGKGEAGRGS